MNRRNLAVLAAGQALAASGGSLVVFLGGIVGGRLAPAPALATLPVALLVVGVAATSAIAALLMERIGRRAGFTAGALVGAVGGAVGAFAITAQSFALLCAATFLIGANLAFVLQYRFAAAESAPPAHAGKAVSIVMTGGIVAGILGPEVARRARGLLAAEYAGAFLVLAGLYVLVALLMRFLGDGAHVTTAPATQRRVPLARIIARPAFVLPAAAGMVAYGSMSLLMTATPISMHVVDGHSLDAAAFVIQSHVVAMYLPSLFTGTIMDRLGTRRAMLFGIAAIATCVALGASSRTVEAYWGALVLLGVGWNFLFVGGTVLLTRAWPAADRFRAQAGNDFVVFGTQAAASLGSGAALHAAGWRAMNLIVLPALMFVTLLVLRLRVEGAARSAAVEPDTVAG